MIRAVKLILVIFGRTGAKCALVLPLPAPAERHARCAKAVPKSGNYRATFLIRQLAERMKASAVASIFAPPLQHAFVLTAQDV